MTTEKITIGHGVKWVSVGQAGKLLFQFASVITLARILGPADYGLMAIALVVTAFAALFRDMGTSAAVIQKQTLSAELTNAIFWINVALGIVIGGLIVLFSPLLGAAFKEPGLQKLLMLLSPVFLLSSIGIVQQALLGRDSSFRTIAIVEIASSALGLGVAILLALKGAGVFALAAQSVVVAGVSSAFFYVAVKWRPRVHVNFSLLKEIWSFSGNIFLFNLLNYFHRNADSMLIGRFIGSGSLGFYNIAYRILLFPIQNITFVLTRAMFPAYSRHQDDKDSIAEHYLANLQSIAFITVIMMALVWALREPFVTVILGEKWLPATGVLAWLAPVGFFQSLVSTSGTVLTSIGRADILRNLGFIGVPFLTLSFVVGLPWGIEGVAACYCIATIIWTYPVLRTVMRLLSRSFLDFARVIAVPTLAGVTVGILMRLLSMGPLNEALGPVLQLVIGGACGVFVYGLLALVFMRPLVLRLLPMRSWLK